MSVSSDFYMARAEESAREAEAATLDNVRDRARRAEAAWRTMADRLIRSDAMRETLAADKAMRADAEAGA